MLVVVARRVAAVELEPGDQDAAPGNVACAAGYQRPCVPSGVNRGTLPAITTTSNVRPRSSSVRSDSTHSTAGALAGDGEHRPLHVGAHDGDATPRELDADPPGAAPGVEHGPWLEAHDEHGLAVDVGATAREVVEPALVVVALPGALPNLHPRMMPLEPAAGTPGRSYATSPPQLQ